MEAKQQIKDKIKALKEQSGTHSPSIATILREIPDIKIEVDACFLSNPYATELFLKYLDNDLIKSGKLKDVLEYYPPQNYDVSQYISKAIKTDARNIFVGNGAIEAIQAVIHNFVKKKICVILPTFSSYYEFVKEGQEVIYYRLKKEENYELNAEDFIAFVRREQPDSIVIINPNNPNGGYLNRETIIHLIENLKHLDNIIIDESFIHFAYEDIELSNISGEELIHKYPNLVIIKSMSKDFGIAGVRAGYAVMHEDRVRKLLGNGYLWNVSGLADYFFKIYADEKFIEEYDIVRKKYILNTMAFLNDLNAINGIKVYPSKANFALVEILSGQSSFDFSMNLLVDNGIYVRDCSDKIGLEGKFLRIASRSFEENLRIVSAIKKSVREA
jgi:histidinol-phosphate/aromatic aminotransferase/cobyric acid decarboxylase-like protein